MADDPFTERVEESSRSASSDENSSDFFVWILSIALRCAVGHARRHNLPITESPPSEDAERNDRELGGTEEEEFEPEPRRSRLRVNEYGELE